MKIIYLEWMDAYSNSNWKTDREVDECICRNDFMVRQTGFLLRETKKYIVLCGSWHPENSVNFSTYGDIHKIPKTWIKNRKTLMEAKQ